MEDDTIVAVSTPPGRGALGVVRLSGPASRSIASAMAPRTEFSDRRATLANLREESGDRLDEAVLTAFFAPHSYTGEDMIEVSCHGSPLILDRIVAETLRLGARAARPGEFTLRAFLNGRIDLTRAEAVLDMVEARTDAGLGLALSQMAGALAGRVEPLRNTLLDLLAHLTALVEFSDEDIPTVSVEESIQELDAAAREIDGLLAGSRQGQVLRHGVSLAIVGPPNAGKSSILNGLLRRDRSIVTPIAGTTRDTVEEELNLDGVLFRGVDTAGLADTDDPVEAIGVERSRTALASADIILLVLDGSRALGNVDEAALAAVAGLGRAPSTVVAVNKCDLDVVTGSGEVRRRIDANAVVQTSAVSHNGLASLREILPEIALGGPAPDGFVLSSRRHVAALGEAHGAVAEAARALEAGVPLDLASLDIRRAVESLGNVLGIGIGDDVLDRVFSRFCIGK